MSFSTVLQPSFLHFPFSVSSSYQPVTNSVSIEALWTPKFHRFVCCCQVGTLCELVSEYLIFVLQTNACFSSFFIGIENIFAPAHITFANIIEIKSMNSIADTACIFFKHMPAFIYPDNRSPISKKGWIFSIPFRSCFFQEKGIVAKLILYFAWWMITNISGSTSRKQWNFQFPQKEKEFPSLFFGNNDFFRKFVFWVYEITLKKTLN